MVIKDKNTRDIALAAINAKFNKGEFQQAAQFVYDTDSQYEFPKRLVKKILNHGGKSFYKDGNYESTFFMYHRLHGIIPDNKIVFKNLIDSFENIFYSFEKQIQEKESAYFTEDDIRKYSNALSILLNFHKVNFPDHKKEINRGLQFLTKLDYISKYKAIKPDALENPIESIATFRIAKIYDAIYEEMTLDQVYQEAARLLAPTIREILSEKDKEDSSKKDSSAKKKKSKPKKP